MSLARALPERGVARGVALRRRGPRRLGAPLRRAEAFAGDRSASMPVVALGAIIRGGTPHFDYVSEGTALGARTRRARYGRARHLRAFSPRTTKRRLSHRAGGGDHGNKGHDAALTAIEMALFNRKLTDDGLTTKRA